jgi:predicted PurR-regulated permease PerM
MKNKDNSWSLPFRYVTGLILFIAIVALLIYAREAVKALIIAAFVAYLISPAVSLLLRNTKLSRKAAVNIVYFSSVIVLVGLPSILTPIFFDEIKIVVQDLLDLSKEMSTILSQPVQLSSLQQVLRMYKMPFSRRCLKKHWYCLRQPLSVCCGFW